MISKKELNIRICLLEDDVDNLFELFSKLEKRVKKLEPKKESKKNVSKK